MIKDKLKPTSDKTNVDLLNNIIDLANLDNYLSGSYFKASGLSTAFVCPVENQVPSSNYLVNPRYKNLTKRILSLIGEGKIDGSECYLVGIECEKLILLDYDKDYGGLFQKSWHITSYDRLRQWHYFRYGVPHFYKGIRYKGKAVLVGIFKKDSYKWSTTLLHKKTHLLFAVSTPAQWKKSLRNMVAIGDTNPTHEISSEGVYLGALNNCERYRFMGSEWETITCLRSPWKDPLKITTLYQILPKLAENSGLTFRIGTNLSQDNKKKKLIKALQ